MSATGTADKTDTAEIVMQEKNRSLWTLKGMGRKTFEARVGEERHHYDVNYLRVLRALKEEGE